MSERTVLLIIDPQNDFCDLPGAALPVTGANADLGRLAALIDRAGRGFDAIHVSLDSHHPVDIAHPRWWVNAAGESPAPFTQILPDNVRSGVWRARDPTRQAHSMSYLNALAVGDRYRLVVWPEHCLIGSWGHGIHDAVKRALDAWARAEMKTVDYVFKGRNPGTEHYSALCAEVPDPADPDSGLNRTLVDALAGADTVLIAGEALSHCVASSVRDLAAELPAGPLDKLVLLTDCSSPVPGFETLGAAFVDDLRGRGMRLCRSTEWRA